MWRSPTEIGTRQHKEMVSLCLVCNDEITNDDKVLMCDIRETWEHRHCIRQADHLSEELYHNITVCNSKSIVYLCTACRQRGSLDKRLLKYELEGARANEQRLASKHLLEERQHMIECLLVDKQELTCEKNQLRDELSGTKKLPPTIRATEVSVTRSDETDTMLILNTLVIQSRAMKTLAMAESVKCCQEGTCD